MHTTTFILVFLALAVVLKAEPLSFNKHQHFLPTVADYFTSPSPFYSTPSTLKTCQDGTIWACDPSFGTDVYKSTDDGESFEYLYRPDAFVADNQTLFYFTGEYCHIACDPDDSDTVYFVSQRLDGLGIAFFYTRNGGESFHLNPNIIQGIEPCVSAAFEPWIVAGYDNNVVVYVTIANFSDCFDYSSFLAALSVDSSLRTSNQETKDTLEEDLLDINGTDPFNTKNNYIKNSKRGRVFLEAIPPFNSTLATFYNNGGGRLSSTWIRVQDVTPVQQHGLFILSGEPSIDLQLRADFDNLLIYVPYVLADTTQSYANTLWVASTDNYGYISYNLTVAYLAPIPSNVTGIYPVTSVAYNSGKVFLAWSNTSDVSFVYSPSFNLFWIGPFLVNNVTTAILPRIYAGDHDTLGVTYFGSNRSSAVSSPNVWAAYYNHIKIHPLNGRITRNEVQASPITYTGPICLDLYGGCSSSGIMPTLLSLTATLDGDAIISYPSNLDFNTSTLLTHIARQTDGPQL